MVENEHSLKPPCAPTAECANLTGQSVALGLVLVPVTVEIQRAALAVGQLAAHPLVAHGAGGEVPHILRRAQERGTCI